MFGDLRYAVRTLRKIPISTSIAVLTLALGIGVNTAIFSVVDAVLLEPLPYDDPDRLVMVWETNRELGKEHEGPSPGNFLDMRGRIDAFDSVTAWFETAVTLQSEHDAEQVETAQVSVEFFETLGAKAAHGSVFLPGDTLGIAHDSAGQYPDGDRVAVISDGLWRRRFGADPAIAGSTITIDGQSWRVLGVMPERFAMPGPEIDLWIPWALERRYGPERFPAGPPRDWRFLSVLARLDAGATSEQARTQLEAFSASLAEQHPKTNRGWGATLTPLGDEVLGAARPPLLALAGAVVMVLLIACANVASLLMARARSREHEMALRAALGASRLRLVRQSLAESMLLALTGGAIGLLLADASRDLLVSIAPSDVPRLDEVAVDLRVLTFTLLVSLGTGIVFGILPALRGSRTDVTTALKKGGWRGATGAPKHRSALDSLVVVEVALALVMLVGAGLFARSFLRVLQVDPGFDAKNLLTFHVTLDGAAYSNRSADYYRHLIERLETLPSAVSAAAVTTLPMSDVGVDFDRPYWREGDPEPDGEGDKVAIRMATPGYFETMGMTVVEGRAFTGQDRMDSPAVVVVEQSMAEKVWPGESPIGKHLMLDYNRGKYSYEVVGVTRGIRYYGLKRDPKAEVFIPHAQNPYLPMNVVLRTAGDPSQLVSAVKDELRTLDPSQPGHNVVTMEQLIGRSVATDRFSAWLLGLLSALALILAATGIYGVMSYVVGQRTHEIGIRMSLGATGRDVLALVLARGAWVALFGIAAGLLGAFALTRLVEGLLFGVSSTDPLIYAAVTSLLVLVVFAACLVPARRATKVEPMEALRSE